MNLEENIQLFQDKSAENQSSYSVKRNKPVGPKGQFCGSKVRPLSIKNTEEAKEVVYRHLKQVFVGLATI